MRENADRDPEATKQMRKQLAIVTRLWKEELNISTRPAVGAADHQKMRQIYAPRCLLFPILVAFVSRWSVEEKDKEKTYKRVVDAIYPV